MAKTYTKKDYEEAGSPLDLVIPEGYSKIEEEAFQGCQSLKSVVIPEGVAEIGRAAFKYCRSLQSVTIPEGVTTILSGTFNVCTSLQSVTILNPHIKIDNLSFCRCFALSEVNLPKGLTWKKIKDKFPDSPWSKTKPLPANEEKIDALSAINILKQALDEVAPESTTLVNSDSMPFLLSMNLMEGLKLNLSVALPDTLEDFEEFVSSLVSDLKNMIYFFTNLFVSNYKDFGALSISGMKNKLMVSVELTSALTKSGNFVDIKTKDKNLNTNDVNLSKFIRALPRLTDLIEKFDVGDGGRRNIDISYYDTGKNFVYIFDNIDSDRKQICISYHSPRETISLPPCITTNTKNHDFPKSFAIKYIYPKPLYLQNMKETVLVFINKRKVKDQYSDDDLWRIIGSKFDPTDYDIRIIDYPDCEKYYDINKIWSKVRRPILIGYKEGANYIESIKNYSRKYLISPIVYDNGYGSPYHTDEYDRAYTDCFFGSDKRNLFSAEIYSQYYQSINYPGVEGDLSFEKGMESVRIIDEAYRMHTVDFDFR